MTLFKPAAVSVLALLMATSAVSAQNIAAGIEVLDDRIDTISREAREDLARAEDRARFGAGDFRPGWSGSLALTYSGKSGNTDTQDFALGGRFNYNEGLWNHNFGFAFEYGEAANLTNKEEAFLIYDANYTLEGDFYAFILGRYKYDDFGPTERDGFIGVGPGYRIVNTADTAWRVQAGPGIRYTRDSAGVSETEGAGILASRFFYRVNETVFLTNDTDVLYSSVNTTTTNEFGVNIGMTDTLSTRLSYRAEYNSDPLPGTRSTDNTVGVSLVVGF